jgi:phenylacetate-CoA ligase
MVHILAGEARARRLRIAPKRIWTSAEPLLPETRAAAEEVWGVPIGNLWGTSEAGGVGTPCDWGSTHLSEDLVILEAVDEQGRPVEPGTRSAKVYLTNLYNTTMPIIRYEITDEVSVLPDACPCGSAYRRVADIQGRLDDTFVYHGVCVHPHVFRSHIARRKAILEYQVRQTARGAAIAIRAEGPLDTESLARDITAGLARVGVREPDVAIHVVPRLERQLTGKLKRFVPIAARSAPAPISRPSAHRRADDFGYGREPKMRHRRS